MVRRGRRPPSQTLRTFLKNHLGQTAACDFFVVPTATFRLLFCFVILLRDRDSIYSAWFHRRVAGMGIEESITAPQSPWQSPYAERVIGSIRRKCLDHVIILGEQHLRSILKDYIHYYNESRPHLSLERNAPIQRQIEPPSRGPVVAIPQVGGLHHLYARVA